MGSTSKAMLKTVLALLLKPPILDCFTVSGSIQILQICIPELGKHKKNKNHSIIFEGEED